MQIKTRLILLLIFLAVMLSSCKKNEPIVTKVEPRANPFNLVAIDDLIEVCDTIQADETVSDILAPHGVSPQMIHDIELKALKVFPLSKFRAGKELYIYAKWDSVETLKYMVYVVNEIDHVIFDLRDSIKVTEEKKPFTVKEVVASGEIKENLSQDLIALGFDENIGYNTADVFESQIDFGALQPNDKFDILYEQIYVEGKPTMIGKILAAKINHKKKDNFAFLYEKEKANSYYDANGGGMLGMFLTAPIKFRYRISSKYSKNRYHPVLHRTKAHLGTDFAAAYGTPIQSTAHGVVVEAGYRGGNGNYVKIKHSANYTTQYLHMSRIAKGMRRGAKVSQGQVIGFVGSTGLASGPHVCYRFWKNGKQVDPFREKNQATASLSKKYKADFTVVKNTYLQKLESPKS